MTKTMAKTITKTSPWVRVQRPAGTFMRDDADVRCYPDHYLIRHQHLKELYKEMSDRLKWRPQDRTPENRQMFNAMGETLRREKGAMGGAPRSSAPRCACGAMTEYRARVRYHYCVESGPKPSPRDQMRARARAEAKKHGG
jgi:hypothetical protein